MTTGKKDVKLIKEVVARRARDFGYHIHPHEVTLAFMDSEVAPRCRIFHAWWGAGEARGSLSGLIKDEEGPDTYPAQALGKIYKRWIDTEGGLPDPNLVAAVSAYIYDAASLYTSILSFEDKTRLIHNPDWLPFIHLPEKIEVAGQPGVSFWRVGPTGTSRIRFYLVKDGQIHTDERFIRDFLK